MSNAGRAQGMSGTFPAQAIRRLIDAGQLNCPAPDRQLQPASLDLTVSDEAYSVPGSMLPLVGEGVRDLVQRFARRRIDLAHPETLVRGEVYVVRLQEEADFPAGVAAYCNNKSSTGRIDLQTRVLTDGNPRYDRIRPGYRGALWLEVIPKSFDVRLRAGDSLNQAIIYEDRSIMTGDALRALHQTRPLLYEPDGIALSPADPALASASDGLLMTLDLEQPIVGFVAKKSFRPVDLAQVGGHAASAYFEPIPAPADGALFLSREAFYIFSTYEYISVPPDCAAEMLPYDTGAGEFRAHYAGFFDPGFGFGERGEIRGTPAVLEVRPYEDDLIVRHRQPVCKMAYERLSEPTTMLYGAHGRSHYAQQRGPRLSKFFVQRAPFGAAPSELGTPHG